MEECYWKSVVIWGDAREAGERADGVETRCEPGHYACRGCKLSLG